MSFLEVKGVSKKNNSRIAVDSVSFIQQQFEKVAIAGETGSGKTSLLKIIGGLMQTEGGEVLFENKKVAGPQEQLIPGHPSIAYLSQYFELRDNYWVYELLEMANKFPENEVQYIFTLCEIDHLLKRRTNELSGGEKQRIALAMQLIRKPKLLLLDEPFSNLDAIHEHTMKQVLQNICRQLAVSCIMVSHDGTDLLSWADTIYIMKDGKLVQQGTPQQVYYEPLNEYCAGLFGDYNRLERALQTKLFTTKTFIRPEELVFTTEAKGHAAVVTNVSFYGSFFLYELQSARSRLRISSTEDTYLPGDHVFITLRKKVST